MRARTTMQVPRLSAQPSERGAKGGKGLVQRRPNDGRLPIGFVEVLLARTTAGATAESEVGDDELVLKHCLLPLRATDR